MENARRDLKYGRVVDRDAPVDTRELADKVRWLGYHNWILGLWGRSLTVFIIFGSDSGVSIHSIGQLITSIVSVCFWVGL